MPRWKPKPAPGLWIGVVCLIIVFAAAIFVGQHLIQILIHPPQEWPVNLRLYSELVALEALLFMSGYLLYRVIGAATLSYELDRNGVYVNWIGNRTVIPMEHIERIDNGDMGARIPWRILQGIGYFWGKGITSEWSQLHLLASLPPSKCLIIHTPEASYAVSPNDYDNFVQQLEQRRSLGAVKPISATHQPGRILFYAFWSDLIVRRALLMAFGLNLILLGILAARYPHLADMVTMRFNALGEATELHPRHQVLFLPIAAFGLMLLNTGLGLTIYRREQVGARVLQIASVLVQVLFGVAILSITAS